MTKRIKIVLWSVIAIVALALLIYPFPERPPFELGDSTLYKQEILSPAWGDSIFTVFRDGSVEHSRQYYAPKKIFTTKLTNDELKMLNDFINSGKYMISTKPYWVRFAERFIPLIPNWLWSCMDCGGTSYKLVNHNGKTVVISDPKDQLQNIIRRAYQEVSNAMEKYPEKMKKSNSELVCDELLNSEFRSVRQKEIGLGPDGPVMGYWTVSFSENEVSWHYSDVIESGTYSCSESIINVKLILGDAFRVGYDSDKDILSWQGDEYIKFVEPSEVACPAPTYTSPHCPKIPTRAKNLKTGEVKEFPDGCLPLCWVEL